MAEEFVQNSLLLEFEVSVDEVDLSDEEEWSEESENEDFDGSWVGDSGEEDNGEIGEYAADAPGGRSTSAQATVLIQW